MTTIICANVSETDDGYLACTLCTREQITGVRFSISLPAVDLVAIMGLEPVISYQVMDKEFRRRVEVALGKALERISDGS